MRDAFGRQLVELGGTHDNLFVLDADVCTSTKSVYFKDRYPDRFLQMGIAEQNMFSVAAGLSVAGCVPIVTTFGSFACRRALDQIAVSIAYPKNKVIICGGYSGLSSGKAGATHQAIEDIAVMRAIPNMTIVCPADDTEVKMVLKEAMKIDGPVYIRVHKTDVPTVFDDGHDFRIGESYIIKEGRDAAVISTGVMTYKAVLACAELERKGVDCRLVHMPTVKRLDRKTVAAAVSEIGKILTVEDHNVIGGLGSAVVEAAAEHGGCKVYRIGIQDTHCESGDEEELYGKYGLSVDDIVNKIGELVYGND